MSNSPRRLAMFGAVAVFSAATAVAGAPSAIAAGSSPVTGGHTYIAATPAFVHALATQHIALTAIAPASVQAETGATTIALPITSGSATPPNYITKMSGGVKFKLRSHVVTLTKFIFNTKTHTGTAVFNRGARVAIFKLGDPTGGSGGPGSVSIGGYKISLTRAGWTKIDRKLRTSFFSHHKVIGYGTTDVNF